LPVGGVKAPKKRRHDEDGDEAAPVREEDVEEDDEDDEREERQVSRSDRKGRDRRKETLGRKQVDKEVFRKPRPQQGGAQWSR
jgi:ATP-dependent RNA helicase DDX18/HAS1